MSTGLPQNSIYVLLSAICVCYTKHIAKTSDMGSTFLQCLIKALTQANTQVHVVVQRDAV